MSSDLTFNLLILLIPAAKLLTLSSGHIRIVGTVHYGGDHTLGKVKTGTGTKMTAEK